MASPIPPTEPTPQNDSTTPAQREQAQALAREMIAGDAHAVEVSIRLSGEQQ